MMTSGRVSRVSTLAMTTRSINPDVGSRCSPRYKNPWIPIGLIVERKKRTRKRDSLSPISVRLRGVSWRRQPKETARPVGAWRATRSTRDEDGGEQRGTAASEPRNMNNFRGNLNRSPKSESKDERERESKQDDDGCNTASHFCIDTSNPHHPLAPDRPFVVCCAVPVSSTGINSKLTSFVELRDDGRNLPTVLKTSLAKSLSLSRWSWP